MSWSGPMAGVTPYPPQPYTNVQPGYGQQPPFQYGQQPGYGQYPPGPPFQAPCPPQRPPNIQPPKKKGNPIITRYPPPPGYRGPAQTQGPFGTNQYPNQYQPPQPGFGQTAPPPSGYPNQGYAAPPTPQGYTPQGYGPPHQPNYPQQPYPQAQNPQWPQPGYPQNQAYPQSHPGPQGYAPPASGYPGYPHQPAPIDPNANQQAFGQAPGWPAPNGQAQYLPVHQYNAYSGPTQAITQGYDPNATPTPTSVQMATAPAPHVSSQPPSAIEESKAGERPQLFLAWDDWDFDFEGAIWPKSNEPVDPNLSLGVIIWHPAKQVTRALPSTFDQAEDQALKPAPEKLDNGESVSVYFMAENSHEAFLDVRQTDDWENIKDDPIFVVFSDEDMEQNLVSLEDCIAQRDRPDEETIVHQGDDDEEMPDASWSVMDHLEQVLSTNKGASRSRSSGPQPSPPSHDAQEDILAKLGVTGAPKPPTEGSEQPPFPMAHEPQGSVPGKHEPAPLLPSGLPLPPTRSQSFGGPRDHESRRPPARPYGSLSATNGYRQPVPPPPPPPPAPQRYSPWNQAHTGGGFDSSRGSPAPSEGSNHTMAGSDFEPDKPVIKEDGSDGPTLTRSGSSFSRKRSYEDADHGDEKLRQQDDYTKRKRRSQVESAYSRR
ncbi:hypothetical protein HBI26_058120 [Parastagonospora nodorum]|nr:hypothetical protein HBI10_075020 [Parastagonospora nodorum]KAH4017861.1 hypothetical protein HBI13_136100 [Parastagonospora nodorum]KAH5035798.1 hypothetical protein HBI75_084150 [Parastagonospora nodorum]KAH5097727.1 hypothetical protein HBH72_124480 [Parastagonospora nodorum]KAH5114413.1 hypothetical protein HBH71_149850 [Parastagonospora nodorum]